MPRPAEDMYQGDGVDVDQCQEQSSSTQPLLAQPSHKRTFNALKRFHSVMQGRNEIEKCFPSKGQCKMIKINVRMQYKKDI